jgi:phage-related protein
MKQLEWISSSYKDLMEVPQDVKSVVGHALYLAQLGEKRDNAKGFKGAGVLEVVDDFQGDTYRAVYTVRLEFAVYVLHIFQKKSKSGIATPKQDIDLIEKRFKLAEQHHREQYVDRSN